MPACFSTGQQQAEPGEVRPGRPDLLPVDDPSVPVADRSGGEAGEVTAGPRLAEQLAPDVLAGPDPAQPALLLLIRPVGEDRRQRHPDADHVAGRVAGLVAIAEERLELIG
jgi:hypothetical protein